MDWNPDFKINATVFKKQQQHERNVRILAHVDLHTHF